MSEATEKKSESEESPDTATAAGEEPPASATPSSEKADFSLNRGTRVEYGSQRGTVRTLRGAGRTPYEVCILWEGEKHPRWYIYTSLELAYKNDEFKLL